MKNYAIELKGVTLTYGNGSGREIRALDNIDLQVEPGEYITIVGGNGTGKSSLLRIISELQPTKGELLHNGRNITRVPHHKRARHIRYVAQNISDMIADSVSLEEQFSQVLNTGGWLSLRRAVTKTVKLDAGERLAILGLGMENRLEEPLSSFSGGEKQAIALLMAISSKPDVLLLDEHTAALDIRNTKAIEQLSDAMIKENSLTTLWVTHNLKQAVSYGNRIILMQEGRIVEDIKGKERAQLNEESLKYLLHEYLETTDV
ncbi:MAG: ABC transporter ATP-binding protein [Syntrophorhabdaceae bacterium]